MNIQELGLVAVQCYILTVQYMVWSIKTSVIFLLSKWAPNDPVNYSGRLVKRPLFSYFLKNSPVHPIWLHRLCECASIRSSFFLLLFGSLDIDLRWRVATSVFFCGDATNR